MKKINDTFFGVLIVGSIIGALFMPLYFIEKHKKIMIEDMPSNKMLSNIYSDCKLKGLDLSVESLLYLHTDQESAPIYSVVSDGCNLPESIQYTIYDKTDQALENIRRRIGNDFKLAFDLGYDLTYIPYTKEGKVKDWDGYIFADDTKAIIRVDVTLTKFKGGK